MPVLSRDALEQSPLSDLHILGRPSFLIAGVIAFTTGMGLYGSAFILPLYLGQIANYTPMQIGLVIMWMGLPQPPEMTGKTLIARAVAFKPPARAVARRCTRCQPQITAIKAPPRIRKPRMKMAKIPGLM